MKHSLEEMNYRFELLEERINELEHKSIDIIKYRKRIKE